jgi:hypothetical protein
VLLKKITEIYDMLSDNIENINSSTNFLVKREKKLSLIGNNICEK